ncbi:MAG TPA: SDR family NAD(P)-dependent oxidoreductase [Actinophytocola sp.]|uniref:SDR family NAD(P)-dependent oxidoreductase n=1 Tax=Actinophytocola sp. TaxID=1872138 RepID=UPI002DBF50B2|nr:SDR family NAD(P)-dependent oxidoreductase [Actinophytocola sp.]HEU5471986.1 SDR family NAD(P)-dependent oxidoreductase [Actinophytocola sp.]
MTNLDGGPVPIPHGAPVTLQQALRAAAELAPDRGTIFITEGHADAMQTYPELLDGAQRVLAGLRAAGLRPGDAALFVFDDNRDFLTAFWACVLGGFVPTPVAVAAGYESANEVNRKLHNAWHLLGRPVLLTDAGTAGALAGVRDLWGEPEVRIHTVAGLAGYPPDTHWFPATADTPVLNLLTSGSTGVPKCVQHTNASVVARTYAVIEHCGLTGDDVTLIWMPFDHVTVAMYNVRDTFLRCLHVNARTNHFLGDSLLWLDWIDRYRVTNLWAPNFAFAMINERAAEIRERSWDLSCVRELTNAGEPVIAATSHRFLDLLAPHGLPADVMTPCWGMSETCSGVTYTRQSRDDRTAGTVTIDPSTLSGVIRHVDPRDTGAVVLSTVGRPIPGVRLRVVNEAGQVLPEGRLGELRISGDTMLRHYVDNDEANRESWDADGWFRTGDLAFVHDGEVVIAGRIKDQIIVRGSNYLAHEIESVVERVADVRVTFVAAAGVREPGDDTDQLVIFFVPRRWDALPALAEEIRATLGRAAGLAPDLLIPVTEAEFPKTGSGKIQRAALVTELRAGTFAGRAIGSGAAEPAADTWFVRRRWVALAPVAGSDSGSGDAGVRLVLGSPECRSLLDVPGPVVTADRCAASDPAALLRSLTQRVSTVVFALPLSLPGADPVERLTVATAELSALIGALGTGEFGRPQVLVLTSGAVSVRPGDRIDLGSCALPGLVRTVVAEADLPVRQVDLPADPADWPGAVRAELADREHRGIVAVRSGQRFVRRLAPVVAPAPASSPVVPGGRYLITGGLGGIAAEIAGHLVAGHGIRLLLVGRSPVTGERAARLAELAALGDVDYQRLDIADADALSAAVAAAEARWGRPLDGVLHLAGEDPTGQWANLEQHTIGTESPATFAEQYRAKVAGTLAIARVLETRPRTSLVLFGSVNGEFGGHSFGAYSAANSFLSGFADHWHHERGRPVRALAWSMWTGVGMSRAQPTVAAHHRGFRSIEPDTGVRLFLEALALPEHQVLIGLDRTNPAIIDDLIPDHRPRLLPGAATGRRRRPVPPATDLERRLARIWSDALNRPEVGREDSFFELGGNSLRAARLLALVNSRLATRVSTAELYANPTVAALAASIERRDLPLAG